MRLVIFGVFKQHFVHVGGGVLEQLVGAAEDDQSDLAVAQYRQLVGFLHQTEFAFGERHLHRRITFEWMQQEQKQTPCNKQNSNENKYMYKENKKLVIYHTASNIYIYTQLRQ